MEENDVRVTGRRAGAAARKTGGSGGILLFALGSAAAAAAFPVPGRAAALLWALAVAMELFFLLTVSHHLHRGLYGLGKRPPWANDALALVQKKGEWCSARRIPNKKIGSSLVLFLAVRTLLFLAGNPGPMALAGEGEGGLHIGISAERVHLPFFGGFEVSETVLISLAITLLLIIGALIIRIFFIPRFTTGTPHGLQNVLEIAVESVEQFSAGTMGKRFGRGFAPYAFSIALYVLGCGAAELMGFRSPVADLNVTASLALMSFIAINYYAVRAKGVPGRLKAMMQPNAFVGVIRIVTDVAAPVSLACRMYGNMLGGLVVMELLYGALIGLARSYSFYLIPQALLGIVPGVAALYFGVFHVAIQAYIFLVLSMTYIHEGIE